MKTDNTHKSLLQASPFRGRLEGASEGASVYTADITHYGMLKSWSRSNRNEMTNAEEALWSQIKGNQLGVRFRRQHIIGNYIVDFICIKLHLIIEVDGEYHHAEDKKLLDKLRDESLQGKGYTILRFSNDEVIGDIDRVVEKIQEQINKL